MPRGRLHDPAETYRIISMLSLLELDTGPGAGFGLSLIVMVSGSPINDALLVLFLASVNFITIGVQILLDCAPSRFLPLFIFGVDDSAVSTFPRKDFTSSAISH